MTVMALLSVAPVREGSMKEDVAAAVAALDDYEVTYETGPMGTTIESEEVEELLAAVGAAHKTVEADRVSTFLKIDDQRTEDALSADEKVEAVEGVLGRPARSDAPDANAAGSSAADAAADDGRD